jgi:hypothetical protein
MEKFYSPTLVSYAVLKNNYSTSSSHIRLFLSHSTSDFQFHSLAQELLLVTHPCLVYEFQQSGVSVIFLLLQFFFRVLGVAFSSWGFLGFKFTFSYAAA